MIQQDSYSYRTFCKQHTWSECDIIQPIIRNENNCTNAWLYVCALTRMSLCAKTIIALRKASSFCSVYHRFCTSLRNHRKKFNGHYSNFELTILGSGSSPHSSRRHGPSAILDLGNRAFADHYCELSIGVIIQQEMKIGFLTQQKAHYSSFSH